MRICSIGGQAVLEGVMMKNPEGGLGLAVRKSDGSIVTEFTEQVSLVKKNRFFALPVVRGVVVFFESLVGGMKITTRSAELYGEEFEEEPTKFEKWLSEKLGKSAMDIAMVFAVILAVLLTVGLFFFLPTLIMQMIPWGNTASIWKSLTEGVIRLLIYFGYIFAISCMKDVKRLFMYHGAEHKVIACYEAELELTPENAEKCTRLHPRCGTNYLFLVMAVSILVYAMLPYSTNFFIRFGTRILFLPLVSGLSYEVLKLAASTENVVAKVVRAPGLALQYLTTKEPTRDMLEVAITAFNIALDPSRCSCEVKPCCGPDSCEVGDDAMAQQTEPAETHD